MVSKCPVQRKQQGSFQSRSSAKNCYSESLHLSLSEMIQFLGCLLVNKHIHAKEKCTIVHPQVPFNIHEGLDWSTVEGFPASLSVTPQCRFLWILSARIHPEEFTPAIASIDSSRGKPPKTQSDLLVDPCVNNKNHPRVSSTVQKAMHDHGPMMSTDPTSHWRTAFCFAKQCMDLRYHLSMSWLRGHSVWICSMQARSKEKFLQSCGFCNT